MKVFKRFLSYRSLGVVFTVFLLTGTAQADDKCQTSLHKDAHSTLQSEHANWTSYTTLNIKDFIFISPSHENKTIVIKTKRTDSLVTGKLKSVEENSPGDASEDWTIRLVTPTGQELSIPLHDIVELRIEPSYSKAQFFRDYATWLELPLNENGFPMEVNPDLLNFEVAAIKTRSWPTQTIELVVGKLIAIPEPFSTEGKINYVIVDSLGVKHNINPVHIGGIRIHPKR